MNFIYPISVKLFIAIILLFLTFNLKKEQKKQYYLPNKQNVFLSSSEIEIKKGFFQTKLYSKIYTKKDNILIKVYKNSILEVEVGLNDVIFWYYSRRENPNVVFYCKKEKMVDNIKKELNPEWFFNILLSEYRQSTSKNFLFEYKFDKNKLISSNLFYNNEKISNFHYKDDIMIFNINKCIIKIKIKNITQIHDLSDVFQIPKNYKLEEMINDQEIF